MRHTTERRLSDPAMARSDKKRTAILDAARELFLRDGFEAASMEAVTARAGVSKATVYSHFPTKHALFAAVIQAQCAGLVPTVEDAFVDEAPPAAALTRIGEAFLDMLMTQAPLALYRVVVAEAPRQPDLGRAFYEGGPLRLSSALARYLAEAAARGQVAIDEPQLAAEQFLGMLVGHHHLRMLFGIRSAPFSAAERRRLVRSAVARFLGTDPAPARAPRRRAEPPASRPAA
ncbi:MAG: TetR/AcrR family transcriptional regulator [Alphaproteobacteria bacterium]